MLEDKVSILIPTYNATPFLASTLQSVTSQIRTTDEIIVIDDHSDDGSMELAQNFLNHHHPNHIIQRNTEKGACSARNRAFELSTGPLIQWLDADDILGKGKLETQRKSLHKNPNSLVVSPFIPFIDNTTSGALQDNRDWTCPTVVSGADWLVSEKMTIPACWLGPRHIFEKAGPWDIQLKLNQDGEYFTRALARTESVIFERDVTVWYRRDNSTSVSQFTADKAASLFTSVGSIHKTALALENSDRMKQMLANRYQHAIYTAYPYSSSDIEKAKNTLQSLPKPTISNPNAVSRFSKIISFVFGWKALTQARLLRAKLQSR